MRHAQTAQLLKAHGVSARLHSRPPTTLRSPTGGMWDRKPVVGRGPRDQSSGQKPRARLPEVLACPAALRFKRANGREAGRAGLPRLLLNRGLNPFLGGVLDECGSEHSKSSRGHFFLKNDPRSLFGFRLPKRNASHPHIGGF